MAMQHIWMLFLAAQEGTLVHKSSVPAGHPIRMELYTKQPTTAAVRLGERTMLASKSEWRDGKLTLSWISTGAQQYSIDPGKSPAVEPAMVGTGDRVTFGKPGIRGRVAVGLYAHPAVVDIDADGLPDLILSSPDRPYNGIYYFHNIGTAAKPLYARADWWGPAKPDLVAADFNGDGRVDLVYRGGYFSDVRANRLSKPVTVSLPRSYHVGRDDFYFPVDWDGDGKIDVLNGPSDWRDYGWDDAYDAQGRWQRGPLHGPVYFFRNTGTNDSPIYEKPVGIQAAGRDIDQYGSPVPQAFDWFKRGVLDLFAGSFVDRVTLYRSTGKRGELQTGEILPYRAELCMIQPRVVSWHKDGRPSLVIGEEGGNVTLLENLAPYGSEPKWAEPRYLEQVDPYVKSGSLSRPVAVDWDGDGDLDLIAGNSGGFLQWFENTGDRKTPVFADRGYLKLAGTDQPIRRVAGENGSVQGPAEAKWGYSNPSVADWDLDGKLDVVVNDIWGHVVWYRGNGSRTHLEAARDVEVEWDGAPPPKPDWVWWQPKPKQLVTQWRTTPRVVDWDRDGLPDIVMLNHQGYLSLFHRVRCGSALCLQPPQRIFLEPNGRFLNLSRGRAGSSGRRKIELVDWDGDGDLDLLTDFDEGPIWYENTGTQAKPVMALRGQLVNAPLAGHNPTPNAADWNGDGKLDILIGAEDGFFYYFDRNYIESLKRAKE
jgi:hypothetical protein